MMSILVTFWMFVALFGIMGALRGWTKELLVIFSMILAMFLIYVLESFTDFVKPFSEVAGDLSKDMAFSAIPVTEVREELRTQFWIRAIVVIILAFFGYQTPGFAPFREKARREKVQDILFGTILGLISGYLIVGTLWSYMDSAHYLFEPFITSPSPGTELGERALEFVNYMPPEVISSEIGLLIAVGISFMFVLVVFV